MSFSWPKLDAPAITAQAALHQLSASVAVARGLASTGRSVDLQGIETAAGRVCAQILDLAPAESSGLKPGLLALDRDIARLVDALRAQVSIPSPSLPGKKAEP